MVIVVMVRVYGAMPNQQFNREAFRSRITREVLALTVGNSLDVAQSQ